LGYGGALIVTRISHIGHAGSAVDRVNDLLAYCEHLASNAIDTEEIFTSLFGNDLACSELARFPLALGILASLPPADRARASMKALCSEYEAWEYR
jgi:hypothetical protein